VLIEIASCDFPNQREPLIRTRIGGARSREVGLRGFGVRRFRVFDHDKNLYRGFAIREISK
jgi:hypothetical protein